MSLKAMEKVCWEATCDNCGEGDNLEYGGSFHYLSREEALKTIVSDLEWVERDGILLCNGCIENEDYPPEDVEKAVASLIEKVRVDGADGSPEHFNTRAWCSRFSVGRVGRALHGARAMSDRLRIVPMMRDEANDFVRRHHRHSGIRQGYRFALGAALGDELVGVAIVGRPVARGLQDGWTAEVLPPLHDGDTQRLLVPLWRLLACCEGARLYEARHLHARERGRGVTSRVGVSRRRRGEGTRVDNAIPSA